MGDKASKARLAEPVVFFFLDEGVGRRYLLKLLTVPVVGDYGGKGRLKFISTPNSGLKRKLRQRFKVYFIDEDQTSKGHQRTKKICTNLKINNKNLPLILDLLSNNIKK